MLYYTCLYETIEGVNTMNQLKNFRRFAMLVLVVAGVLTMAACTGGEKTPYGSLKMMTSTLHMAI